MIIPKALSKAHRIVFIHIPKTSGTSTAEYFANLVGRSKVAWLGNHFTVDDLLKGQNFENYRVIGGHFRRAHTVNLPFPIVYISFVREPVDRVISYYQHMLRTPTMLKNFELTGNLDEDLNGRFGKAMQNEQSKMLDYSRMLGRDGHFGACQMKDASTLLALVARKLDIAPPPFPYLNKKKETDLVVGAETRCKIASLTTNDAKLFKSLKTSSFQRLRLRMCA